MHGNVSEWVLDQYDEAGYAKLGKQLNNPLSVPSVLFPRTVRGGSWQDEAAQLRSAVRVASTIDWKEQDPQIPQSIWYHTDALHVGFRIVRPLKTPSAAELKDKWNKSEPVQHDKDNPKKFQE
jgi:formylglycine-generating enzyme required for sulfatase activity